MRTEKSIFIAAGEPSGDLHGSSLMKELNKLTSVKWFGLGGDLMSVQGLNIISHIKDLASTGVTEVARKFLFFKKTLNLCVRDILSNSPSAVILIDYPGFNIRLAEAIREKYSGKIIYYISPQLWAWHEKRVLKIKKNIDKMLVVFPFEVEFYARFGIEAEYVGHPLVQRIGEFLNQEQSPVKEREIKVITLLPGSRNDEIKHHLPVLVETAEQLANNFNIKLFISKAPNVNNSMFNIIPGRFKDANIIDSGIYPYILRSDLVMTKAGTSTMECSLLGTPFLIFYKTHPLNYVLLKPIVKINKIGIINILTRKNTVREFIQNDFTALNLYEESKLILTDEEYREKQRSALKEVWDILGNENASFNAANNIKRIALA